MGLSPAQVDAAIAGYREHFGVTGIFENRVYDGIEEALDALLAAGWTLAIATSKPEPFATRIADHFELTDRFTVIAGATLDGTRRHKSDVIAHALAQLADRGDGSIGAGVMIGDRAVDIAGGHRHGLATIGVVWGYGSPEELIEAAPSALSGHPRELPELIAAVVAPQP